LFAPSFVVVRQGGFNYFYCSKLCLPLAETIQLLVQKNSAKLSIRFYEQLVERLIGDNLIEKLISPTIFTLSQLC